MATKKEEVKVDRSQELVPIKLFKDNDKYKFDLTVIVNGRSFQIQRGKQVMVPRYVADVILQSEIQDQQTADLMQTMSDEAQEKMKNM